MRNDRLGVGISKQSTVMQATRWRGSSECLSSLAVVRKET